MNNVLAMQTNHTQFADIKGMGEPARRALAEAGYGHLEQLVDASEKEFAKLHGMGPKALRILGEELARRGLGFKAE